MPEILEHALRYAALGWAVFPLAGKDPYKRPELNLEHGFQDATTHPDSIRAWWDALPSANVGIATGYHFWLLDVDIEKGGYETLEHLESEHGKLPDTLQAATGSGGRHYLFKQPEGWRVRNSAGRIGQGIDTRGDGGYMVAAPSVHPHTGVTYQWDGLEEFEKQPILDAPEWLLALIRPVSSSDRKPPMTLPEVIKEGTRNPVLFSYAAKMRNANLGYNEILGSLRVINSERVKPPLLERELEQIARSASRYEPKQLQTLNGMRSAINEYAMSSTPVEPGGATPVDDNWKERTIQKLNGTPKNLLVNMDVALTCSPEFNASLAFNEFTGEEVFVRDVPGGIKAGTPVSDREIREVQAYLQKQHYMEVSKETVLEGIELVAARNSSHPIRNYLRDLQWDGVHRVDKWLTTYLGVRETPYTRAVGRRWLISAVARVEHPGCKVDCCLVLEGPQGIGKSTALRNLASGDWYSDTKIDFASKDGYIALRGVWIYEIGELDAYNKSEAGDIKRFMSAQVDKYRGVHAKKDARWPRQCVFAATVNPEEYLKDRTGNRRFWPVRTADTGEIDNDALLADRDQLWAEAMTLHTDGAAWYLDDPEVVRLAEDEQAKRMESDVWDGIIEEYCEKKHASHGFTTTEILRDALLKPMGQWTRADEVRVAASLKTCGFTRVAQCRDGGSRVRRYYLPIPQQESVVSQP